VSPHESLSELTRTLNAGCACGGAGCAHHEGSARHDHRSDAGGHARDGHAGDGDVIKRYGVDGMTCDNCVRHVEEAFTGLPGVTSVSTVLVSGGTSTITVGSERPLDADAVRSAVEDAGYSLAR